MTEENNTEDFIIQTTEENLNGYLLDTLLSKNTKIDKNKIRRTNFDLSETHNFEHKLLDPIRNLISRKNIIYYGMIFGESPVPIEATQGNIKISTINKRQIVNKISMINEKDRSKIAYIHISTIQIILKSTFAEIDTPIELEIRDNRIIDPIENIIAKGKVKFDINIQLGLSLLDRDLENSITLRYKLIKDNLMYKGNHPFTVTYKVNYALTNSHHSITFKTSDKIQIDELFKPLLSLESPNIIRNRERRNKERKITVPLVIREPGSTSQTIEPPFSTYLGRNSFESTTEKTEKELQEIKQLVKTMSLRLM